MAYFASGVVLIVAKMFCNEAIQGYVATFGALGFAASYAYNLSILPRRGDPPVALLILPVFLAWGFLAIFFDTRLIGFLTVAAYEAMFGFFILSGPLYFVMGFERESVIPVAIISSGTLLAMYIIYSVHWISLPAAVEGAVKVFIPGVLFLGTFVYFLGLLIYSSRFVRSGNKKDVLCSNCVAIISGFLSFYLGSLSSDLSLFRGVGSTFFVAFLMQKYIEIEWKGAWSLGLLGGCILVIGLCFFIKSYPALFAFY